jgi:hypothetical protein
MQEFWYRTVDGTKSLVLGTDNLNMHGHPLHTVLCGLILESQRMRLIPSPLSFTQFVGLVEHNGLNLARIRNCLIGIGVKEMKVKLGTSPTDCAVLPWNDNGDFQEVVFELAPEPTQNDLYRRHIESLDLSVRARRTLARHNINTVGDLMKTTEYDLLLLNGMGNTTLNEIRGELRKLELTLKKHP